MSSVIYVQMSSRKPVKSDPSISTMPLPNLLSTSHPLLSIVDPIYSNDSTVGKLTAYVAMHLFVLAEFVSHVTCRCSGFAMLILSPLYSILHSLNISSLTSIISLSGSHDTRSSTNSIAQGVPSSITSVIISIMITNNSGLSAEPWRSPTSQSLYLWSRTGHDACLASVIRVPDYVYVCITKRNLGRQTGLAEKQSE